MSIVVHTPAAAAAAPAAPAALAAPVPPAALAVVSEDPEALPIGYRYLARGITRAKLNSELLFKLCETVTTVAAGHKEAANKHLDEVIHLIMDHHNEVSSSEEEEEEENEAAGDASGDKTLGKRNATKDARSGKRVKLACKYYISAKSKGGKPVFLQFHSSTPANDGQYVIQVKLFHGKANRLPMVYVCRTESEATKIQSALQKPGTDDGECVLALLATLRKFFLEFHFEMKEE